MLEINAAFGQEGQNLGLVGRTGEDSARVIVCDCAQVLEEYPGAEIVCAMRRACDAEAYAHTLTADGSARRAVLTAADVAAPGSLMIEFRAVRDGQVLKSAVYVGRVERGLAGQTAAPGNPVADVIDRLNAQAEAARKAADAAQQMADEVRRKLEAGELNGSDAEVTAENIQSALGYAPVKDVQLAGKSTLTDGVAVIPFATEVEAGVVRPYSWDGTKIDSAGRIGLFKATQTHIDNRISSTAIAPTNIDYAVTAAMTDGKGPAWTASQQAAARERMGIDKPYELIEEIAVDEDNVTLVERDLDITRMYIMIIGVSGHSGTCALETSFDAGNSFTAYWGLAQIAAQYEVVVEHGTANGYYKFSNTSISSTPTLMGINLNAMEAIFSAATKPSRITRLKISGPIPNGTKFKIYGVRT